MFRDCLPTYAAHLRERGYAEGTVRSYQRIALRWRNSHRGPADWLQGVLDRSRAKSPSGRPTTTVRTYQKALRSYLEFKGMDPSLASLPRVLRYSHPKAQRALTRAEEAKLREALEGDRVAEPMRTALLVILATGLRRNEALQLRLADFAIEEGSHRERRSPGPTPAPRWRSKIAAAAPLGRP